MESAVTAPVSGHIKRVVVQEGEHLIMNSRKFSFNLGLLTGDSINQGDLIVEIVH
jgi:pyruvate carboxylase